MSWKETSLRAWQRQAGSRQLSCHSRVQWLSSRMLSLAMGQKRRPAQVSSETEPHGHRDLPHALPGVTGCPVPPLPFACLAGRAQGRAERRTTRRGTMAHCVGMGTGEPTGGGKGETGPWPRPRQALPASGCGSENTHKTLQQHALPPTQKSNQVSKVKEKDL